MPDRPCLPIWRWARADNPNVEASYGMLPVMSETTTGTMVLLAGVTRAVQEGDPHAVLRQFAEWLDNQGWPYDRLSTALRVEVGDLIARELPCTHCRGGHTGPRISGTLVYARCGMCSGAGKVTVYEAARGRG